MYVTHSSRFSVGAAVNDLVSGFRNFEFWTTLGGLDISKRYRRSRIGPLWTTLSLAIFIGVLGTLYAEIFGVKPKIYVPHLTLGMICWNLMTRNISEGCNAFKQGKRFILEGHIDLSVFVYRTVWRTLRIFAYEILVFVGVVIFLLLPIGWTALFAILGIVLIVATAIWAVLLTALLATRFTDVSEMISIGLRIAFFATPVLWFPKAVGVRSAYIQWNPFYHYIEMVRSPLMGELPDSNSVLIACIITVAGWVIALPLFAQLRQRVPFWL